MDELRNFLKSQKALSIATYSGNLWISNVYFACDDDLNFYFISPDNAKHSLQIKENGEVAFSTLWFDESNYSNRKGVQAKGHCSIIESDIEIRKAVKLLGEKFPQFKKEITFDWIKTNKFWSKVWVIKTKFLKFWNDELYGDDETEEFTFS
jgi:uncharacterized protein YhbP (UPF0306 family)